MILRGPFTARWLDGREWKLLAPTWPEDEIADLWESSRAEGAVVLLDAENVVRDSNYTEALLAGIGLRPGARVRHRRHPELTGTIQGYEYHERGSLSPMPLRVYWDQSNASELLGWFSIYPAAESLEPLAAEEATV